MHDKGQPPATATAATTATPVTEPELDEVARALDAHAGPNDAVRPGVAARIAAERGWGGRLMDVLGILTEDAERMGYLAGGRKPGEVMTWLALWADSPLTVGDIRAVVACGGWDPEPFVPVVRAGLLDQLLHGPSGGPRRVHGELAGGWLSDQFALADDDEVLRGVRDLLAGEPPARTEHAEATA